MKKTLTILPVVVLVMSSFANSAFATDNATISGKNITTSISDQYNAIIPFIPDVIKKEGELKRAACILRIVALQEKESRLLLSSEEIKALENIALIPPTGSIDGVNINKKCQYGYFQKNGNIEKLFIVSTGKKGMDTKDGTFKVHYQYNGWWESTLYPGSMLYRPKYFYRGMALHGLKSDGSVHTYPASHGCVRVTKNTINYLWKVMNKESLVRVSGVY